MNKEKLDYSWHPGCFACMCVVHDNPGKEIEVRFAELLVNGTALCTIHAMELHKRRGSRK